MRDLIKTIAAVVSAVAAVATVVVAIPRSTPLGEAREPTRQAAAGTGYGETPQAGSDLPTRPHAPGPAGAPAGATQSGNALPASPTPPMKVLLVDGEQRVVLPEHVGLAVEFQRIGVENFVTLRISVPGRSPIAHALLGAGGQFEVKAGGRDYLVSVLQVDHTTKRVTLQVDPNP